MQDTSIPKPLARAEQSRWGDDKRIGGRQSASRATAFGRSSPSLDSPAAAEERRRRSSSGGLPAEGEMEQQGTFDCVVILSERSSEAGRPSDALHAGSPSLALPVAQPLLRPCFRTCWYPDGRGPPSAPAALMFSAGAVGTTDTSRTPAVRRAPSSPVPSLLASELGPPRPPRVQVPAEPRLRLAPRRRLRPTQAAEATSCGGCAPPADALLPARHSVHCILRQGKRCCWDTTCPQPSSSSVQ